MNFTHLKVYYDSRPLPRARAHPHFVRVSLVWPRSFVAPCVYCTLAPPRSAALLPYNLDYE